MGLVGEEVVHDDLWAIARLRSRLALVGVEGRPGHPHKGKTPQAMPGKLTRNKDTKHAAEAGNKEAVRLSL